MDVYITPKGKRYWVHKGFKYRKEIFKETIVLIVTDMDKRQLGFYKGPEKEYIDMPLNFYAPAIGRYWNEITEGEAFLHLL